MNDTNNISKWYLAQGEAPDGNYVEIREESTDLIVLTIRDLAIKNLNKIVPELTVVVGEHNKLVKTLKTTI